MTRLLLAVTRLLLAVTRLLLAVTLLLLAMPRLHFDVTVLLDNSRSVSEHATMVSGRESLFGLNENVFRANG